MHGRYFQWAGLGGLVILVAMSCGGPAGNAPLPVPVSAQAPWPFPAIEDNIAHDTLLIQTTFDLGDGTFIMVAGNVDDTFEGLRLYRYRLAPGGDAELLAVSSPAYDSWTMLPSFFPMDTAAPGGRMWILANFGERESWGQKVLILDEVFRDIGFMDAALPQRVLEDDTLRLKRGNVAPHMRFRDQGDTAVWHFTCDSVYLYDDQSGGHDRVLEGHRVRYTYHRDTGLQLWIDGSARTVREPA